MNYLPARLVWTRYNITSMTLHRWLRDESMKFPAPIYLGRFRYWRVGDLEAWEAEQALLGRAEAHLEEATA